MKLFPLTILSLVLVALPLTSSKITCPHINRCKCTSSSDSEYLLDCGTNATTSSAFHIIVQPKELIHIQCRNSPDWSTIFEDASLNIGPVKRFVFSQCTPSGGAFIQQMNVSDVEMLKFEGLRGKLRMDDLGAFPTAKHLILSSNKMGAVDPDLLKGLPMLRQLELAYTGIEIPHGFFKHSFALKALELSRNRMRNLEADVFDGLHQIELLNLWQNNFTSLDPRVFRNLSSLISLDIHQNNLVTLPADIFNDLVNLTIINLRENNFTSLPKGLFDANTKLKIVKLYFNKVNITSLPSGFLANLPNLKIVSLMRIGLLSLLEDTFWGSFNLTELNLNRNYMTTLPVRLFRDATNLVTLSVSFNDLQELPDNVFARTKKLTKLDLSKNHLTAIKEHTLVGLESLIEINLENNDLEFIDFNAFRSLSQLKIAKFANNRLMLQTGMMAEDFGMLSPFHLCESLEELYLAHNNVTEIYSDWIVSNTHLQTLDLRYNQIEVLDTEDLQFVSNTIDVDLRYNAITRVMISNLALVAGQTTKFAHQNITIHLSDNPFLCDCSFIWLSRYIHREMAPEALDFVHLDLDGALCAQPEYRRDMSLTELTPDKLTCKIEQVLYPGDACEKDGACDCWFRVNDRTLMMNCAGRNLTEAPEFLDGRGIKCIELDLEGNQLVKAPNMAGPGYEKVCKLNLARNRIRAVDKSLISPALKVLNLEGNKLRSLNHQVLDLISNNASDISELTLHDNPWRCDCTTRDFLTFIQSNSYMIPDILSIGCTLSNSTAIPSISSLSLDELCVSDFFLLVSCVLVASALALLIGAIFVLYLRFQIKIKTWLFNRNLCLCLLSESELDQDKTYDAFVSYSHLDDNFVLKQLVARLESGPAPLKLCIHERDWMVGENIPTQIARSVSDSRRTIIVLSPNFLESDWGRLEFKIAHHQGLSDKRTRVVVVLYGDIGPVDQLEPELRAYLQTNTYIKWGDPWFWQKLIYALPPSTPKRNLRRNINMVRSISIATIDDEDIQKVDNVANIV